MGCGGSTDRVVVGKLDVRWMKVPTIFPVVHHRCGHLDLFVVDTLNAATFRRVAGACSEYLNAEKIVDDNGEL